MYAIDVAQAKSDVVVRRSAPSGKPRVIRTKADLKRLAGNNPVRLRMCLYVEHLVSGKVTLDSSTVIDCSSFETALQFQDHIIRKMMALDGISSYELIDLKAAG